MTFLAFTLPFLVYIALPSRFWNFDGVACAAALELGNPLFLFHSNHLLYGFFGFLFWKPLAALGMDRALPALQLFTSILSTLGLAGLYFTLRKILSQPPLALGLTLCASVTAVVWVWSVEAQVYALGFLAISWATFELFQPEHRGKWPVVGALHAAAVLGHVMHVLWIVPALYVLWRQHPQGWQKKCGGYLLSLACVTLIPYAIVFGTVVLPPHIHDGWWKTWLLGSAALNTNSTFQWHLAGWSGPWIWAQATLRIFWGSFWPYQTTVPIWCWMLTGVSAVTVVWLGRASFRQKQDPRWMFSWLWIAVYGVFFWTWEPGTECYRFADIIPISIIVALGLKSIKQMNHRWAWVAVLGVTLLPVNLWTRIKPMHRAENNRLYQEVQLLMTQTPPNSVYLTQGGTLWIYMLYFGGRTTWNLRSFARVPARLESEIARHLAARPVFIRTDAQQSALAAPWIRHYKIRPVGDNVLWFQIKK